MIKINKHPLALKLVIAIVTFAFATVGFAASVNVINGGSDERHYQVRRRQGELAAVCNKMRVRQVKNSEALLVCEIGKKTR